jgi:hypothetical protein
MGSISSYNLFPSCSFSLLVNLLLVNVMITHRQRLLIRVLVEAAGWEYWQRSEGHDDEKIKKSKQDLNAAQDEVFTMITNLNKKAKDDNR